MSLPVLVAIVVLGIALSVAAVHFTGGSRKARLADARQARDRFAQDYPDEQATSVRLTSDGQTAFLEFGNGRLGIVQAIGDCFLTRLITRDDLAAPATADAHALTLRLGDFTWKGGRFVFADAADARSVLEVLQPQALNSLGKAA